MNCNDLTLQEQITNELQDIDLTGALTQPAVVERYTTVRDGTGGRTETWVPDSGEIMVNVMDLKPVEQKSYGERFANEKISQQIKTSRSVILKVRDRLVVGDVVGTTTYEVMGVVDRSTLAFLNLYFCIIVGES